MTNKLLLCLPLLLLAGCPVNETRDVSEEMPMPANQDQKTTTVVPAELLQKIRADLAERSGTDRGISVQLAEAVVYNDGSLGCPEPGMMYTQALVNGYRVVLQQDGQQFDYRASERGYFRLCQNGKPPRGRDPRI
ncbi:MAG: hypothetical protein KJO54_00380 [Gammaproteobacteria bacterium]|nr:hypothetical protein [Gammaproteobacteria bacterium]NNF62584.1 hypothetical protein [Gammaproteobacteria bacterium]NNM19842.1 hypothetical protein [Gammaproteobacteria bacterium]